MIPSIRMARSPQAPSSALSWDSYLVEIGQTQNKAAFGVLFEHFSPLLKSFLMGSPNINPETAEELVQETMIKVWRNAPSFAATQASASTWIYTIARNTRIDWLRKHKHQTPLPLSADDIYVDTQEPSPHAKLVQLRRSNEIQQQLSELPQEQSEVLNMMYFKGQSGHQVAQALALPLGTVKSRVRLALSKLRIGLAKGVSDDY